MSISAALKKRLQDVLTKCGVFDNDLDLQALFTDERIAPWRDGLPTATNRDQRVTRFIDFLGDHYDTAHNNVLVLFIHVLAEQINARDLRHQNLQELAAALEQEFAPPPAKPVEVQATPDAARLSDEIPAQLRRYLPYNLYNDILIRPGVESEQAGIAHLKALLQTAQTYRARPILEEALPAPHHVQGRWLDVTLLFADVSGFTALSEKLSTRGRAGAEELTAIVNRYFTAMVNILYRNGGLVLKFGGDALLGMFTGPATDTARYAVQAAMDMQRAMVEFVSVHTSVGDFRLQMKAGAHTGRVFAGHVGNGLQMEYWVLGDDVNFTAVAEEAAATAEKLLRRGGQVVASKSTVRHLRAWRDLEPPPGDPDQPAPPPREPLYLIPVAQTHNALPARPAEADHVIPTSVSGLVQRLDIITPYLPHGVLPRLIYNPRNRRVEGEHRLAAVLFINVDGFNKLATALGEVRSDALLATMQDYFFTLQTIIEAHGGIVNKTDLYDPGDKVLAIFGAPKSHEDDADQAARAALKLQAALEEVNQRLRGRCPDMSLALRQRIGLSTGFVFSGNVGAEICQEYTIMGDNVNLAARLMSKASWGEIWVSDHAHYWLAPFGDFEFVGELRLKGKQQPAPTYRLLRMHKDYRPHPRFVDRVQIRAALEHSLEQLQDREGQIAIVSGGPGMGKSRLWAEMRQVAEAQGVYTLVGHCQAHGAVYPLWAEMLRQHLGVRDTDDLEIQREKLIQCVTDLFGAARVLDHAPFLAIVLGLPLRTAWKVQVEHLREHLAQRLATEVQEFFAQLSEIQPLLLICEDLHELNEETTAILLQVVELVGYAPVMLGFTLCPGAYPLYARVESKLRGQAYFAVVEYSLPLLDQHDSLCLAEEVYGNSLSEGQATLMYQMSDGVPLFIVEITRALASEPEMIGAELTLPAAPTVVALAKKLQAPPALYKIIESQIDALPEEARQVLRAAAVIGIEFTESELFYILPEVAKETRRHLATLRSLHLIDKQARDYHFLHGITHAIVYEGQSVDRRRGYHIRLGDYWQKEGQAAKSAAHYFAAELWPQALTQSQQAAIEYQQNYACSQAIHWYEQALQAAREMKDWGTQLDLYHCLGEVYYFQGDYIEAEQAFLRERAGLVFAQSDDISRIVNVHIALAQVYDRQGAYPQALGELDRGLMLAGTVASLSQAQLWRVRCSVLYSLTQLEAALDAGRRAVEIAQTVASPREEAYAWNNLGAVYGELEQFDQELECHQHSLNLRRELSETWTIGQSLCNVGTALDCLGKAAKDRGALSEAHEAFTAARAAFVEALQLQQQIGDRVRLGSTYHSLAWLELDSNDNGAAEENFRQALHEWERIKYRKGIAFAHHDLGEQIYIPCKQWDKAREHLETARQMYIEIALPKRQQAVAALLQEIPQTS
ncbi:MAG TPA: adenylate/guanylate cyclase domain-containing protein [Anaerolineae bacterium]|nr:adenylate/guanylate cyclase domain-containing protein [Anaerolineae bacterium]